MKLSAVYSSQNPTMKYTPETERCEKHARSLGLTPMLHVQTLEHLISGAEVNNIKDVVILSPGEISSQQGEIAKFEEACHGAGIKIHYVQK